VTVFKPAYTIVVLTTNGKEFGAFKTNDPAEAKKVIAALNTAISSQ